MLQSRILNVANMSLNVIRGNKIFAKTFEFTVNWSCGGRVKSWFNDEILQCLRSSFFTLLHNKKTHIFETYLSHGVASGSDITPYNKIDKPLVV